MLIFSQHVFVIFEMKLIDKFPAIFKKWPYHDCFKGSKEIYRPLNILPIISKIFEKIISKQIINLLQLHYYPNTNMGFEEVLVHKIIYWQC